MLSKVSLIFTMAMPTVLVVVIISILISLTSAVNGPVKARSFTIDYEANTFLMDGKPFRYISGSFHYFRALPETWRTRLRTMRAAGLNAVDTYVEWSLHNPNRTESYDFEGIADIEKFIQLAQEEDLYVIFRPGPYICAERDNGGLPYWLFTKYPNIKLRTSDPNYLAEVKQWFSVLMPKMEKYLYGNGGPIIMVQVENEYGAFPACDKNYLEWLRDEIKNYTKDQAVLFTTDIPDETISCGKIDQVFATTDFGADRIHEIDNIWKTLRSVQKNGPLVNSEYYPGWLTHWKEPNQRRDPQVIADALRTILKYGASVNIYMFFGGTNFGFTAGANDWGPGNYTADITSYDYDAPMTEAGDPTKKYHLIRDVIAEFESLPAIPVPDVKPKSNFGSLTLQPVGPLFSHAIRSTLGKEPVEGLKSFEELDQFSGFVLYETRLPPQTSDPIVLTINGLHDRAHIFVDELHFVGTLARDDNTNALPLSAAGAGKLLKIFVENQGRINFHDLDDRKGILGNVTIRDSSGAEIELDAWHSTSFPMDDENLSEKLQSMKENCTFSTSEKFSNPFFFYAKLTLPNDQSENIYDTYLDFNGWGKGVAYINGFNLGRYWPLAGPQKTLYVPKELLKPGPNVIIILELEKYPENLQLNFTDTPILDG